MSRVEKKRQIAKTNTWLGPETKLKGTLRFKESVKISGRFQGTIDSTGFLYVDVGADVRADIKAESIIIGGVVHGNVEAAEGVEILPDGKVFGNIRTKKLRIADGVVFEGKCEMIKNPDGVDLFASPLDQAKPAIQRV